MPPTQALGVRPVHRFLDGLFDDDLHAKRVPSLANATLGVIRAASLAVAAIGRGLVLARGLTTKHTIKQVDRLLSNPGIDIDALRPGSAAADARECGAAPTSPPSTTRWAPCCACKNRR